MFLNWITQMVKAAVLRGFREAVEELDLATDPAADQLEELKKRMALRAPAADETARSRKKAS